MNFTKIIVLFLILIPIFSIPVMADDVITNGDFFYNWSGWTHARSTNYWNPSYSFGWLELNATTHDGYVYMAGSVAHAPYYITESLTQSINTTDIDMIYVYGHSYGYYSTIGTFKIYCGALTSARFTPNATWNVQGLNISSLSGIQSLKIQNTFTSNVGHYGSGYNVDWVRTDGYIPPSPPAPPMPYINYTQSNYTEYETSYVNYNITQLKNEWSEDNQFYLNMFTPQSSYYPYYYYEEYLLTDNTGSRSLEIGAVHPEAIIPNCTAVIIKKNATDDYEVMGEWIEADIIPYNHTLLEYSNYDYLINQSYITGNYITVISDIEEYIETDYLGYPDELFTLWIYAYSNSNEGNVYISHDLDSAYWSGASPYNYQFDYKPYMNNNFNASIESYISVYRNGNTTQLTPTIYTNMYADGYIPEGETGYIPPEPEEPPEDPEIPDPEDPPENPEDPEIPNEPTGTNTSINITWMDGYYDGLNNTCDTLFSPMYNFTNYTLMPIIKLNNSISEFNYNMNASFIETTEKTQLLTSSFNIIFNSFHPKIVSVITYYLMWLVLLIILKKR